VRLDLEPERRAAVGDLHRVPAFVRAVFCHRRKLLRGVLLRMAGGKASDAARERVARAFAAVGLGPDARAEEIDPNRFVQLEQAFYASETGS